MMAKLKAQMAVTLDGFIARKDGEIDWIPQEVKDAIGKVYSSAKTLISGSNTYNYIFERWGGWPYKGKQTFVIASSPYDVVKNDSIKFITDNPFDEIRQLKEHTETDLVVLGGGKVITSLINTGLLDELTVYTVPLMLGEGIPFIGKTIGSEWELSGSTLDSGTSSATYRFIGEL